MNASATHFAHSSCPTIDSNQSANKLSVVRRLPLQLLFVLAVVLGQLWPGVALANEMDPPPVDAADRAYMTEYAERAYEKYATTSPAAVSKRVPVDAADRAYLAEYNGRAVEKFAAVQSRTPLANRIFDWSGELFLAEYEQMTQANYAAWLATQEASLAVEREE